MIELIIQYWDFYILIGIAVAIRAPEDGDISNHGVFAVITGSFIIGVTWPVWVTARVIGKIK